MEVFGPGDGNWDQGGSARAVVGRVICSLNASPMASALIGRSGTQRAYCSTERPESFMCGLRSGQRVNLPGRRIAWEGAGVGKSRRVGSCCSGIRGRFLWDQSGCAEEWVFCDICRQKSGLGEKSVNCVSLMGSVHSGRPSGELVFLKNH
jgi:hypothetical protein